MTPRDTAAVFRAMRWARDNGWRRSPHGWWESADAKVRIVATPALRQVAVYGTPNARHIHASSVEQAVELLCSYGVLPPAVSTAYQLGYAAGRQAGNAYDRDTETGDSLPDGIAGQFLGRAAERVASLEKENARLLDDLDEANCRLQEVGA